MYLNSLDTPFLFDDRHTVLLNPVLADPWNLPGVVLHNIARPVVTLSYAIDAIVWGLSSFGFHVTNIALHILVVGLFYGVCTRALGDVRGAVKTSDPALSPSGVEWGAFFAAAVFAVHPVMSSAVNYVTARSELLSAAAVLAALTYARRAIVNGSVSAGWLSAGAGVVAVGSSSSAAVLPLLVLAYDAWILRQTGCTLRARRYYVPAIMAVGIAIAFWVPQVLSVPRVPPRGVIEHVLGEAIVIWRYLVLLVLPRDQSLVHAVQWPASVLNAGLIALAATAGAATLAVRARARVPLVAFGAIWFLGVLAPTAIAPVRDGMSEPRLYLATQGLLLAAASVALPGLATRRVVLAAASAIVLMLGILTFDRNREWRDPMGLWQAAVRRAPDAWQARFGYAQLLHDVGQCAAAANEYREVLRLYPSHAGARAALNECR